MNYVYIRRMFYKTHITGSIQSCNNTKTVVIVYTPQLYTHIFLCACIIVIHNAVNVCVYNASMFIVCHSRTRNNDNT